jgi:hypothetical protein
MESFSECFPFWMNQLDSSKKKDVNSLRNWERCGKLILHG